MNALFAAAGFSFVIALLAGPMVIARLRRLKFGQTVRPEGPATHLKKSGIPTMGGVLILIGVSASALIFSPGYELLPYALFITLGFGLIGLVDDLIIITAKRSLGLKARQKLAGQVVLGLILALYALVDPDLGPRVLVPFTESAISLPEWIFVIMATLTVVGSANAVNLTDGLDGLAAGSVAVAMSAYAVICWLLGEAELAVFSAAVAGACVGFAWFNSHPAQVFMGDTGSLSLGAALGAVAVLTGTELSLLIIGGLFAMETLSVIIQVSYFKLTKGKRVFRMSPLHHHFELSGWDEPKVVTRFWIISIAFGVVGILATSGHIPG